VNNSKKYFCLQPSKFRLDGGAMFGIIPKQLWEKVAPPDEFNRIDLSLRLLLIKTENRVIVIDTGIGDYHDPKFNKIFDVRTNKTPIKEALNAINLTPDDVTDLIVTHLHFDHAGGIGEQIDGEVLPVFKKATVYLHRDHWNYSLNPTARDAGSFQRNIFEPVIEYYKKEDKISSTEICIR